MDRLPLIVSAVLALGACQKDGAEDKKPPVSSSRVDTVMAKPVEVNLDGFCDARPKVAFSFPELAGEAPKAVSGWRWINVWATWCKPCIEEMPRLVSWEKKLGTFSLQFLSVDESDEVIADYRKQHPETPAGSLRVNDPDSVETWFTSLGLDRGATIPVHIFVNPSGKVSCVRAGAVTTQNLAEVKELTRSADR
jgi:thiol-disulfide isomerase/thioredoxin